MNILSSLLESKFVSMDSCLRRNDANRTSQRVYSVRLLMSLLPLLLISCKDITHLQKDYVSDRDTCRSRAEGKMGSYTQPDTYTMNDKEKNNALLFLFCECMKEHEWNVVGCKEAKSPTAVTAATPAPASVAVATTPYTPPPGYALVPVQPQQQPVAPVASPGAGAQEPNAKDRVFFDYNSVIIKPEDQMTLQKQAEWLRQNPNVNVVIEGHCDERGTREYNIALGERRANAVKNYLSSLGISPSRMETVSYGKELPDEVGSNEGVWSKNRRSVVVLPKSL